MSLLVLIIWAIDPQYRLYVMIATTACCSSRVDRRYLDAA
jgi:uncharacterized membrane protein YqjE